VYKSFLQDVNTRDFKTFGSNLQLQEEALLCLEHGRLEIRTSLYVRNSLVLSELQMTQQPANVTFKILSSCLTLSINELNSRAGSQSICS